MSPFKISTEDASADRVLAALKQGSEFRFPEPTQKMDSHGRLPIMPATWVRDRVSWLVLCQLDLNWEERISTEKMPLSAWPIDESWDIYLINDLRGGPSPLWAGGPGL